MLGLTLEGGGARGAFQIGAVKAFLENGYKFDGITGTSIGALNGAMIAQGDIELAEKMWHEIDMSTLFPADDSLIEKLKEGDFSRNVMREVFSKAMTVVANRGVDTEKIRALLNGRVNEKKLRESEVDFGLVTCSLADKDALTIFLDRIPKGMLIDYLVASAMLPIFKNESDTSRRFVDGGYFDVCPFNMLIEKGYKEIVVVRLFGIGIYRKPKSSDVKLTFVVPSEKLSGMLDFTVENINHIMTMGYYDALRVIKHYKGVKYCIRQIEESKCFELLCNLDNDLIERVARLFGISELPPKRLLFEFLIPIIAHTLKLEKNFTYCDLLSAMLECLALNCEINRFAEYDFTELLTMSLNETAECDKLKIYEYLHAYSSHEEEEELFKLPAITINSSYDYRIPREEIIADGIRELMEGINNSF